MKKIKSLNNAQRKALAELLDTRYRRLISDARDKEGELAEKIQQELQAELGADTIDNKIASIKRQLREQEESGEAQIKTLEENKESLGFGEYRMIEGSKAKRLADSRLQKESVEVSGLERQREQKLIEVWTANTGEEVIEREEAITK